MEAASSSSSSASAGDSSAPQALAAVAGGIPPELPPDLDPRVAWRASAPLLYELFIGCALEWPALSVAWLPDDPEERCRLAIGVQTDGSAPHEVIVAELTCDRGGPEAGGDSDADPWLAWSGLDGLGDAEGFGCSVDPNTGAAGPLRPVARLVHPTEVNRIVPCPVRGQLLATKAATGAVLLFDYKAERPSGGGRPDACLVPSGDTADGFALDWSCLQPQLLATGGNDGRLCVWEVNASAKAQAVQPLHDVQQAHAGALCAAAFARSEPGALATVGDDGFLRLWDLRAGAAVRAAARVSGRDVLTVDWSGLQGTAVATAGKDQEVYVWDLRALSAPLHTLRGHEGDVVAVRWAPFRQGLLGSCSADGRLNLWDLAAQAPPGDSLDEASPELLFAHDRHRQAVSDFAWSDGEDYLISSVSEDNGLHIWQPAPAVYLPDDSDDGGEGAELPAAKRPRGEGGE